MIELLEIFEEEITEYDAIIYVYLITHKNKVIYGHKENNGYIKFFNSLSDLFFREFNDVPNIEFKIISNEVHENKFLFEKWVNDNF